MKSTRREMIKAAGVLVAGSAVTGTSLAELADGVAPDPLPSTLLPYLQNPAPDAMSICFLAREAKKVAVAWTTMKGTRLIEEKAEAQPIDRTPWTRWKVRLTELKPGATYRYQVRYELDGEEHESEIYPFQTLDPKAEETKVAVFNDIHNRRETITAVMKEVDPDDFEYAIFNGDLINDPSAADGAREVFELWDFYVGLLQGYSKPILFVRGNHEVRGSFKNQLQYLFELPDLTTTQKPEDQQWQYEWSSGPVHFIAMDTGEDDGPETPEDSYKAPRFWNAFRRKQAQWLADLARKKVGADKPWRIFVSHIPLHNPAGWYSVVSRDEWLPHLRDMGVSLMLAGHDHSWKFLPDGKSFPIRGKADLEDTPEFPVMIGGGPSMKQGTVILVHANPKKLSAKMHFTDGKLLHSFSTKKTLGT